VLVVLWAAATARLFIWPETTGTSRTDAVVVFGANIKERLARGRMLADDRVAPTLVLSALPPDSELCPAGARTFRRGRVHGICVTPRPYTTRGEAQTVSRLAERRGWRDVTLVTSTYHVTRARLLFGRCFAGRIQTVAATPQKDLVGHAEEILHEWGGLAYSVLIARGC
jgi:uncharacterized SAM-binding protein YcdF (DUF218 family)